MGGSKARRSSTPISSSAIGRSQGSSPGIVCNEVFRFGGESVLTSYASRSYRYWGENKDENWPLDPCGDETKQAVEGRARSLYPPPGTSICSSNQNYVCTKNSYFDIILSVSSFCFAMT